MIKSKLGREVREEEFKYTGILDAGVEADSMEECCLLTCSSRLTQPTLSRHPGTFAQQICSTVASVGLTRNQALGTVGLKKIA